MIFLSTPSARRATPYVPQAGQNPEISIHALREEGDRFTSGAARLSANFYPRPPRGGRPPTPPSSRLTTYFYPRPPRGGRLQRYLQKAQDQPYFYPRPPRGGRPGGFSSKRCPGSISIHALREEGDQSNLIRKPSNAISIHALREEGDVDNKMKMIKIEISIHALREEGDSSITNSPSWPTYFYPRPPRGGRHIIQDYVLEGKKFLSTPSARRATDRLGGYPPPALISIHALREEGDYTTYDCICKEILFLSTPSARRATPAIPQDPLPDQISIHALREEGDKPPARVVPRRGQFLSTPSARRATQGWHHDHHGQQISIHALREEGDSNTPVSLPPV